MLVRPEDFKVQNQKSAGRKHLLGFSPDLRKYSRAKVLLQPAYVVSSEYKFLFSGVCKAGAVLPA